MVTRIHEINTLSEYIALIEKYGLFNCISRGENAKYDEPLASGIKRKGAECYKDMLESYHLEIEHELSGTQNKHFPAFAQHHGIPTNLLDFSYSPLTSLYFSVDDCNDAGYIYFISKDRLVQINNIITNRNAGWGMMEELLQFDPDCMETLIPGMTEAFMTSRESCIRFFEEHIELLIKQHPNIIYEESSNAGIDGLREAYEQYLRDKERWAKEHPEHPSTLQIYSSYPNLLKGFHSIYYQADITHPEKFYENYSIYDNQKGLTCIGSGNVVLMLFLLKYETLEILQKLPDRLEYENNVDFPLYCTYRPPVVDERVRNQHSVFVFQPFGELTHKKGRPVWIWQTITPDFVVKVKRPDMIRRELDAIGINLKSIYCDYDSAAKYVVDKKMNGADILKGI